MAKIPEGFVKVGQERTTPAMPEGFSPVAATQTPADKLISYYRQGRLGPRQQRLVEELAQRHGIDLTAAQVPSITPESERLLAMQELAQDQGFFDTLGISTGKGFMNVGRGVGLADEPGEIEQQAYRALQEERPATTMAGEIIGEAAPFLPAAVATGGLASVPARMAATGALGATEGAILADDTLQGAVVGGGIGLGAEVLFPVVGRLGRKVFQRVTGRMPKGAVLTPDGKPTPEMQDALQKAGMTFEDLTEDAAQVVMNAQAGSVPKQVARATRFTQEGVPATRGEITQDFAQQATEQRLLHSAGDIAAEPFRQFKLRQSKAVERTLRDSLGLQGDVALSEMKEPTGQLIKEALEGRKNFLRSTKNELYDEFAELSKSQGFDNFPIMVNSLGDVLPDARALRGMNRASKGSVKDGLEALAEYGLIKDPQPYIEAGIFDSAEEFARLTKNQQVLTIDSYDDLLQQIKGIMRADTSDATKKAFSSAIREIEDEAENLTDVLSKRGDVPESVLKPLKEARKVTKTLKTEFAPKDIASKLIDARKGGGTTQITEASKVYDNLMGAGSKVEDVRKVTKLLRASREQGPEALGALQSTAVLDLIDGGFTTKSMKVAGEPVFNPTAFKNRLAKLNKDGKIDALFANKPEVLRKIKNIDKIASDLIPPNQAVPKGSAASAYFNDLLQNIAFAKVPGANFIMGMFRNVTDPIKTSMAVKQAQKSAPEVVKMRNILEQQFPGIAVAMGIPAMQEGKE